MATINQLDPIRVVFSVADRIVVGVEQRTGTTQSQIVKSLVVGLVLPDGSKYKQTGKIAFLNNQVDPQTGTLTVYADFANPDRLLLPGVFVNVDVRRAQPAGSTAGAGAGGADGAEGQLRAGGRRG